jgi:hypothetical protein
MIRTAGILLVGLVMTGCATTPRPIPLTQVDIISMTKAGATEEEIMRRIDQTRTVFRLNSDDVVRLRNEGVGDRIVTYMLDTYTRAAVAEERRRATYSGSFYYGPYFYPYHPWWRWHYW